MSGRSARAGGALSPSGEAPRTGDAGASVSAGPGRGLARRFLLLWVAAIVVSLAAWTVGHRLLPPGALRGALPSAGIPGTGSFLAVAGRILFFNAAVAGGIVLAANLFRVGRFPLGYFAVLLNWLLYGLFLGTNSFGVVRDRPTAPSLVRLVRSTGFTELTGFTLLAAATAGIFLFRQRTIFQLRAERVRGWRGIRLSATEWWGVALALLLLAGSAAREAASILGIHLPIG